MVEFAKAARVGRNASPIILTLIPPPSSRLSQKISPTRRVFVGFCNAWVQERSFSRFMVLHLHPQSADIDSDRRRREADRRLTRGRLECEVRFDIPGHQRGRFACRVQLTTDEQGRTCRRF